MTKSIVTANAHIKSETEKMWQTAIIIENYQGTIAFNKVVKDLDRQDSTLSDKYLQIIQKVQKTPEGENHSTFLAAPKVNACSVMIIKKRTSGEIFMLHHNPDNQDKAYDRLFSRLSKGDHIDVLIANNLNKPFFEHECQEKEIVINSSRLIRIDGFNITKDCFRCDDKHFKFINIAYNPSEDRLIFFADELASEPGVAACYSAQGIFAKPHEQIKMNRVHDILGYKVDTMIKELDASDHGWTIFKKYLPPFSDSFAQRTELMGLPPFKTYVSEIAQCLYNYLAPEEREQLKTKGDFKIQQQWVLSQKTTIEKRIGYELADVDTLNSIDAGLSGYIAKEPSANIAALSLEPATTEHGKGQSEK